jgi:hypothetical protein
MRVHQHYFPILKGKAGELAALEESSSTTRARMTPIVEIPAVEWDYVKTRWKATVVDHVAPVAQRLVDAWAGAGRLILDGGLLNPTDLIGGEHPIAPVTRAARALGLTVVPVWSPSRSAAEQAASAAVAGEANSGVCVRLSGTDLGAVSTAAPAALQALSVQPEDVDLVLDFAAVSGTAAALEAQYRACLGTVPMASRWRTLVVAGSAFPVDLSGIKADHSAKLEQLEWDAWSAVASNPSGVPVPAFGDYGIANPTFQTMDPRFMNRSAQIRYTTDDGFLVLKGRSVKAHGAKQQHALSALLIAMPEFHGGGFSAADAYIAACAVRTQNPGSAKTWRTVGMGQHFALMTSKLASHP